MRNKKLFNCLVVLLLAMFVGATFAAEIPKDLPREDVIEVPAIGEGLCVSNLFQTNMVLQRDKPVSIWGWAAPGEKVTVSFAGQTKTATAGKDRAWKVTLDAMPVNTTPQKLTVKGKDKTLTLENILVGDVWVLGGQSNMEMSLRGVESGQLEIMSANFPNIRILTVPAQDGFEEKKGFPRYFEWSNWSKRHSRKGDWDICSPEAVTELSAIGYVFARRLYMASQVPIGVIDTSRGGTTVEAWTPPAVLKKINTPEVKAKLAEWDEKVAAWDPKADLENRVKRHNDKIKSMKERGDKIPESMKVPTDLRPGPAMDRNRPGNCYNSIIAPIAGLAVKGAIFHQGYNNAFCGTAGTKMYYQMFGPMVTAWRSAFNDAEMPFGIISLCTAGSPQTRENYLEKTLDPGIYIREAQYKAFLDFYKAGDKNIGFASSFDKRHPSYHPKIKIPVGERIARWALATQYGLESEIKWKPPMLKEMKVEDGKIILAMDTSVGTVVGGAIEGFAIAGEDRKFQPADASWLVTGKDSRNRPKVDRSAIVLTSPLVPKPVHFRYAWGRNPMGNLQASDSNDLPFATQRSDSWKMEEVPNTYYANPDALLRDQERQLRGQAQKDLRLDDTERRLKEAQAFIDENKEKYEKERAAREKEMAKQKEMQAQEK